MAAGLFRQHGAHHGPIARVGRIFGAMIAAAIVGLSVPATTFLPSYANAAEPSVSGPHLNLPPISVAEKKPEFDSQVLAVSTATHDRGVLSGMHEAGAREFTTAADTIRVIVTAAGSIQAAGEAVISAGGRVDGVYADLVQAYVPVDRLAALAQSTAVRRVARPSDLVLDSVVDEGVAESNALAWHDAEFTGSGVKVGIVDGGFIGYVSGQATGDLPASLTTADFGCGGVATGTNHGTAVAEVVHKEAPDAQLYLICVATVVDLGLAKDYAIAQGITIVNMSGGWYDTARGDGTGGPGTPDGIVADARANGILWVNSAGNQAQGHWSGPFTDAHLNRWHEFTPTDELNEMTLTAGETVCVFLKWDDWPVSDQDYDVYLFDLSNLAVPAAGSTNPQDGTEPPAEEFCAQNVSGGPLPVGIGIWEYSATETPRFDLFVYQHPLQYQVAGGSLAEPAESPNAMAVGAICWKTGALEPYSSRGPTIDGRIKPDISGPTRTSSAVFGSAGANCTGGFGGTSASAPHVAGAAALVAEQNPSFTPAQIQAFLEAQALDLGTTGKDNSYGSGRLWLGTAVPDPETGATYVPLAPARLLDTRTGNGLAGAFSALVPRTFQVTGRGGVPDDATAVTGNLTVTAATQPGFVFLGPYPVANPPSSTLNFPFGDTRANGVTVALGADGTLSATFGYSGTTHLIFDVTGYFVPDDSGATFFPLAPARILDTRTGNGLAGVSSALTPRTFQVTGHGNVPAEATAVTGNLTVTGSTQPGFVFLGPDPIANPSSSTINFPKGDNRANGVTVALSATGTLSATCGYSGTTHLIFDVTGYFLPDDSGASFVPLSPARLLDSRSGNGLSGVFARNTPRTFQITGRGGVPSDATAVTGNVTSTASTGDGFVFVGPAAIANPTSSTLNFPKGDTRANGVTVALSGTGKLSATFGGPTAGTTTHLIFDVTGYFR